MKPILFCLLLTACYGGNNDYQIIGATPAQEQMVVSALEMWGSSARITPAGNNFVRFVSRQEILDRSKLGSDTIAADTWCDYQDDIGHTFRFADVMIPNDFGSDVDVSMWIRHELGHAIGHVEGDPNACIGHIPDGFGIMDHDGDYDLTSPTQADYEFVWGKDSDDSDET